MSIRVPARIFLALLVTAVCSAASLSQGRNATIRGVLLGDGDNAISGASVTISLRRCRCDDCDDPVRCDCCPQRRETVTGADGTFSFEVPPGTYDVMAEIPGFAPLRAEVELTANEVRQLRLSPATFAATVADQIVKANGGGAARSQGAAEDGAVEGRAVAITATGKRVPLAGATIKLGRIGKCRCEDCADRIKCECCPAEAIFDVTTDAKGNFTRPLPVGKYKIVTLYEAFSKQEIAVLEIEKAKTESVKISLSVGNMMPAAAKQQ